MKKEAKNRDQLKLKNMVSAPKPKEGENFKLLVLDEYGWSLVYWLDSFEGSSAGWYGDNCNDLRNPKGWIVATSELVAEYLED
jgi:hypothetical protein